MLAKVAAILPHDMAGFTHADHYYTALTGQHVFTGADKIIVDPLDKSIQSLTFNLQNCAA